MEDGYSILTVVAQVVAIIAGIITIISFFTRKNDGGGQNQNSQSQNSIGYSKTRKRRFEVLFYITCVLLGMLMMYVNHITQETVSVEFLRLTEILAVAFILLGTFVGIRGAILDNKENKNSQK